MSTHENLPDLPDDDNDLPEEFLRGMATLDEEIERLYPPEIVQMKLDLLLWEAHGPDW